MPSMEPQDQSVPEPSRFKIDPKVWATLCAILAVALILRGLRINELPGGFLAFNEIFYIDAAVRQLQASPIDRLLNPGLYDKPPLYTNIITLLYSLKLPLVAGGRAVSVLAGTFTVFMTFLLAREFFTKGVALASAAFLAVMPGVVLVDHNIQVDSLFVALLTAAVYCYIVSDRTGRIRDAWFSGVLLGLSVLVKQPAILALPAIAVWEVWRCRGIKQLKSGRFAVFAALSLVIGLSWYFVQLIMDPARLMSGMQATGGRAEMSAKGAEFLLSGIPTELAWMVFPATALIALVGLFLMMRERTSGDRLTVVFLVAFLIYYIQYHFHSYYLLPMAPFLAIAAGRASIRLFAKRWPSVPLRIAFVTSLCVLMLFGSVIALAGHKWGRWSPLAVGAQPGVVPGKTRLFVDPPVTEFLGPFLGLLSPALKPVSMDMLDYIRQLPPDGDNSLILTSGPDKDYPIKIPAVHVCEDLRYRPVLFGYAIGQWHDVPQKTQVFLNADWSTEKVGNILTFGYVADSKQSKWTLYDGKTLRSSFIRN